MREPMRYSAPNLINQEWDTTVCGMDGIWRPARPLSMGRIALRHRLRMAWRVFTGRYDVLMWPDCNPDNYYQE